jgi:hypothetical protein
MSGQGADSAERVEPEPVVGPGGPVISKPAEDCKKIGDFGAWIAARRRVFLENLIIYEL